MPTDKISDDEIKLIHYNLAYKPWHFDNVLYKEHFWKYAEKTEYIDEIRKIKKAYTESDRYQDMEQYKKLQALAQKECDCVGDDRRFRRTIEEDLIKKSQDRLEVLEKIKVLEQNGVFDVDVEDDPETIKLTADNVDYLKEKRYNKLKNKVANKMGMKFLNDLLKDNKLIIKQVIGIENLQKVKTGAIITCNHFNPYDSFAIEKVFRESGQAKEKKLYKVIREGNYTNFPGLYGFFFRNCDTLPLSSSNRTMIEFLKAVDTILQIKDFILI